MSKFLEWYPWSPEQIVHALPDLIRQIESNLEKLPAEYRDKNRSALESLKTTLPTPGEVRDGVRSRELVTLGYVLDVLGRRAVSERDSEGGLRLLQAAHELFRGGHSAVRPSTPMRQTLSNALKVILEDEIKQAVAGHTDAGVIREKLYAFVTSAWGDIPSQLSLSINEMILAALERTRVAAESDVTFQERFVRDNIEAVLAMEIPTRLEEVRERWEEIGQHVAPAAVRVAQRALRRPQNLSRLLTAEVWSRIQKAVERGDIEALERALAPVQDALETNLRLRLDAKADYRQPVTELRYRGGPDRFFLEARDLLLRRDPSTLQKFSDINYRRPNHSIAKEWYAYALTVLGHPADIYEIITQLEEAIQSEYYREDVGWTARWNLACALRRLPDRANEALDILRPTVNQDAHSSEVFELCLLWALEQDRSEVLASLLLKSPYHEAHLLAALQDAEIMGDTKSPASFRDHFRRINRILQAPDRLFPNPKENLSFRELDQLTRDFIESSLVQAGIEWFRQRASYGNESHIFKNWECAALLNEKAGDLAAAWRCRERLWATSEPNRKLDKATKTTVLRSLLLWAQKNGFQEQVLAILNRSWRSTSMSDADVALWKQRLSRGTQPATEFSHVRETAKEAPRESAIGQPTFPQEADKAADDTERVIQETAPMFAGITTPESLAVRAGEADRLINSALRKHGSLSTKVLDAIREVIALSVAFARGVDQQGASTLVQNMTSHLSALKPYRQDLPFELHGLAQACERVIHSLAVRVRALPDLTITPPSDLKIRFGSPSEGEAYFTHLFARVTNPAPDEATNIKVAFMATSPGVRISNETMEFTCLGPGEKMLVESGLEVRHGVQEEVDIRVHVTYEIAGVSRVVHATGKISVGAIGNSIPVTLRYVTHAPVTADRADLFHGRDRELTELMAAFAGGKLRRLYFVNGIRRVGKSTLMHHLGGRCSPDIVPLVYSVETLLGRQKVPSDDFVRQLILNSIEQVRAMKNLSPSVLEVPPLTAFQHDPPWRVFDNFLQDLKQQAQCRNVLLCFDEVQHLVKRIADTNDPMDDGFLSWLRGKIQTASETLTITTGSEPFAQLRQRYNHVLWGNMEPYNVSFVDRAAMTKIATLPVEPDGVVWLNEALDRVWEMTEGHPWIIQILAEKVAEQLNRERRRIVGPGDIDRAAGKAAEDSNISELWWNEQEGLVTTTHRQIAFLILQNQQRPGYGIPETQLAELAQASGIRTIGRYLDEMRSLEVLTDVKEGGEPRWRIRGAFLERHLVTLLQRTLHDTHATPPPTDLTRRPLALMLDWENVKICLTQILKEMPEARAKVLQSHLETPELASHLLEVAARHGSPRQRWAVADWDRPFFQGDQKAFKNARFWTDIAGDQKANASDHVLLEKIHFVLREHPEIEVYVIGTGDGDFHEAIKTLQEQGKRVILWSTRRSINKAYGESLKGPDRIVIEWLEDVVFEETLT